MKNLLVSMACFLLLSNCAYAELFDSSKRPTPMANSHIVSSGQPTQPEQPAIENVQCSKSVWCPNAETITEQTICANENLWCLDNKLNELYRLYRPIGQKRWRNERDSCGSDVACINLSYTQRIAQISQSINTQATQSTGNPLWCHKASNTVEKMICGNSELSNLDNTMTSYWNAQPRAWRIQHRQAQRNFLKNRNACNTVECVKTEYVNLLNGWGVNIMNPLSQSTSSQTVATKTLNFSLSTNRPDGDKLLKIMYAVRDTYGDNTPLPILLSIAAVILRISCKLVEIPLLNIGVAIFQR